MQKANALGMLLLVVAFVGVASSYAQQGGSDSLTAEDYVDIQQLYARYNHAIDNGEVDAYVALYSPDGSFNDFTGHDGLRTFMNSRTGGTRRHWNTNLVITPTPEGASGAVYLMFLDVGVQPPAVTGAGRYEDTLVKTAQGWRFKTRRTFRERPASP